MPGFNRTGPTGEGPMTGKGFGRCTGNYNNMQGNGYRGIGRGLQQGFRRLGRGGAGLRWRNPFKRYANNFNTNASNETILEDEIRALKAQLSQVEQELEKIRTRKDKE